MGISISRSFDPSGPANAGFTGMGDWAGPGGGAPPGYTMDIAHSNLGYNPAIVAANAPGVNVGNQFAPTSGFDPFNPNPYNIDNITQPTDWYGNPTSGWESFAPTTGVNPFNSNPFNIDNITQPTFNLDQYMTGYPNQTGVYAYPGNLGYSGNPLGSMIGGTGGGRAGLGRD